jgi:hypothetical protein
MPLYDDNNFTLIPLAHSLSRVPMVLSNGAHTLGFAFITPFIYLRALYHYKHKLAGMANKGTGLGGRRGVI